MFPCIQGSISFSKCFWEVVPSALGSRSVFPRGFPASRLRTLCTRSHTCTRPLLDGFAVRRSYPVPKTQSTVEFKRYPDTSVRRTRLEMRHFALRRVKYLTHRHGATAPLSHMLAGRWAATS